MTEEQPTTVPVDSVVKEDDTVVKEENLVVNEAVEAGGESADDDGVKEDVGNETEVDSRGQTEAKDEAREQADVAVEGIEDAKVAEEAEAKAKEEAEAKAKEEAEAKAKEEAESKAKEEAEAKAKEEAETKAREDADAREADVKTTAEAEAKSEADDVVKAAAGTSDAAKEAVIPPPTIVEPSEDASSLTKELADARAEIAELRAQLRERSDSTSSTLAVAVEAAGGDAKSRSSSLSHVTKTRPAGPKRRQPSRGFTSSPATSSSRFIDATLLTALEAANDTFQATCNGSGDAKLQKSMEKAQSEAEREFAKLFAKWTEKFGKEEKKAAAQAAKAAKKAAKKGDEDKKRKLRARQLRESRLKVGHVVAWMSCEKPETWEMRVIRGLVRLEGTVRHVPFLDEDASTSSDAEVGLLEDYDPNTMLPLCDPEKRARGVVLKRGDRVLSRAFENSDDPEGRLTTALYFGTIVMVEDRPGDFLYSVAFDDGEQDEDGEEAAEPQKHIPNSIALFSRGGA
mmetsp:Transcript_2879/g.9377  ORF Transcript_2879/g.9377 Transcript_2879/m.9377 type:complete len:514 (-) Transcript_2879:2973-4514(-)